MKYLCLVYGEESVQKALSKPAMDKLIHDSLAYDEELRKSGHFLVAQALEHVKSATTLRERNGKLTRTDGPFAETKEQLLGFVMIEARDRNEAIEVASKIPMVRVGSIEVRPVMPLGEP